MDRKQLLEKLELAALALPAKDSVPVFHCFMFYGDAVRATDGDVGISIPCELDEKFAVNGKTLLGLISNSNAVDVDFTLAQQDVEVKAGRSRWKLPFLPKEDFLFVGAEKMKNAFTVPITEELLLGIKHCLMTSSYDDTKRSMMGLTISRGKTFKLYSCDGDALTRFDTQIKCAGGNDIMLSNSFCEAIVKIAAATGGKDGTLFVGDEWARAMITDGHEVHGHLLVVDNPLNYEDVIKKTLKGTPEWASLPDTLNDALSRALVLAKPESAKTVLTVEGGKLKLLTETHMGIVRDTVGLSGHQNVTADVSAELMQRTIDICQELTITDRCVAYRSGDTLLQIISNVNK